MRRVVSSFLAAMASLSVLVVAASLAKAATSYTFTQIDVPGAIGTSAIGINNAGQIVGSFSSDVVHGFLDTAGSFTQIDVPGAMFTEAFGINDDRQIVGYFQDSTFHLHGFLDSGKPRRPPSNIEGGGSRMRESRVGSFAQIDVPGATSTQALGINNASQIVGAFSSDTVGHGFLDTRAAAHAQIFS